jgi:hypothetical protein
MGSSFFNACGMLAAMSPFLAIVGILCWHFVRQSLFRGNRQKGKLILGLWSSALLLGTALQFLQVIYRPSVSHALEAEHDDRADEEDSGDPETLVKQLNRQLRRIRQGEQIDKIVLRLDDRRTKRSNYDLQ